jgi:phosphate transport system substrate-binding protein
MSNSIKVIIVSLVVLVVFITCRRKAARHLSDDTATTGTVQLVADESFRPILDQEIAVFKALYPDTKPEFVYKTEHDAVNLFLDDSIRIAILARDLKQEEIDLLTKRTLPPEIDRFALDAIVLIVNKESPDTTVALSQVKAALNGKAMTDKNIVFDNPNSSLVRYLKELSGNKDLKEKNIFALKSNKDVIKYVSENKNAIGIVGFSWLDDPDADYAQAAGNVKVVGIKDESNKKEPNVYFKPSQETLALKEYPLSRGLYIANSTGKSGLAKAFADFLKSERGQRIILKSGLLPDSIPQREIRIRTNLNVKL